ncbi:Co2+/Mg2+ efflux protein ApaG [Oxalobacter formigenes]|uniref:Protein ApaG n=1 Tax=Oxalobacter formigenes OXCC13 TaxID=556269 RepID=C3XBI6_OXAFO|nr:Co2+/Mg2+ efflux protein ApaG [Oxalobacter formigenes]ARQ45270.1 CO2+/MG2+ efflux protein ApaG [Oxalobacter formigenes]ARQ77563.1 Co2+/Mg2+ efflux protein ApaG [Oxalobacter formigenes OXCC13]EEO30562.1 protein ApaG [Oxalobacter formigenes OXCC13]MCZ4062465.1 Co2+/Mg2+ efflux protein ApaG [Oxalobacter formigenes]QDX33898.1 Co2+/Mg2+ efflux protein ApaG [Oxalobacter formigenes]
MSPDLLDVSVTTRYIDDQSAPDRDSYVFTYSVTIKNKGQVGAQLIARHWIITDANNHVEEIRGLGVVGRQPLLKPGEEFEYTSGTSLATPQGSMQGEFLCVTEQGEQFSVEIPEFLLSLPRTLH